MKDLKKMKEWTTSTGEKIPYDRLTLRHIYNILNYARAYGFQKKRVSHSVTDNMDDVTIYEDCSKEVIKDMLEEITRRNIHYVYYLEKEVDGKWKRISPLFTDKDELHKFIQFNNPEEYHIVKEIVK